MTVILNDIVVELKGQVPVHTGTVELCRKSETYSCPVKEMEIYRCKCVLKVRFACKGSPFHTAICRVDFISRFCLLGFLFVISLRIVL